MNHGLSAGSGDDRTQVFQETRGVPYGRTTDECPDTGQYLPYCEFGTSPIRAVR